MGNLQVLIVDDYPEMRHLIRDMLHAHPGISVIGEAGTGEDAVAEATRLRPTVIIIDFRLPTMSGIEATRLIKLQSPSTAVIGLTAGGFQVILKRQCSTLAQRQFWIKKTYSILFIPQSWKPSKV